MNYQSQPALVPLRPFASRLKWLVALSGGGLVIGLVCFFSPAFIDIGAPTTPDAAPSPLMSLVFLGAGLMILCMFVPFIAFVVWIYRIWNWFPEETRYVAGFRERVSPLMAAGPMFVPVLNLIWALVFGTAISRALTAIGHALGRAPGAKNGNAFGVVAIVLAGFGIWPAAFGCLAVYMFRTEAILNELVAASAMHRRGMPSMAPIYAANPLYPNRD